ncbi:MAG: GGDEF domain-containing protein [Rhizobiales bacterium]|nr:GGDEF domain-containing protein [Hyphomicrobiales bacterium]
MAIFMFDIDKFKSINDRFGHPGGDKVIKLLATTAKKTLRQTDVFGRLGGEEFAAFLGNTDEKGAVIVAERVRLAFKEAAKVVDGTAIGATVSIGVTFTTNYQDQVDGLLGRADEALYEAKNSGRNRVMVRSEHNAQVAAASIVPDLSEALAESVTTH